METGPRHALSRVTTLDVTNHGSHYHWEHERELSHLASARARRLCNEQTAAARGPRSRIVSLQDGLADHTHSTQQHEQTRDKHTRTTNTLECIERHSVRSLPRLLHKTTRHAPTRPWDYLHNSSPMRRGGADAGERGCSFAYDYLRQWRVRENEGGLGTARALTRSPLPPSRRPRPRPDWSGALRRRRLVARSGR